MTQEDEITRLVDEFTAQTLALRAKPDRTEEEEKALQRADEVIAAILSNDPAEKRRLLGDRSSLN